MAVRAHLAGPSGLLPPVTKKTGHVYAMFSFVGPHFFSTMSIPILAGRGFNGQDTENSVPVWVVNQALVRKFFPNTNPIGNCFFGGYGTRLIVGICATFAIVICGNQSRPFASISTPRLLGRAR